MTLFEEKLNKIVDVFANEIVSYYQVFENKESVYFQKIENFKKEIEELGFVFSNVYHTHGIGNNNEYTIYYVIKDENGFPVKREVVKFSYVIGVYGGVLVSLKDVITDETLCSCGRAY